MRDENAKRTCLNISVFPRKNNNNRQTADDDTGQDEDSGAHHPVERHHTGSIVFAGLASLWTGQTLKHPQPSVLVLVALEGEEFYVFTPNRSGDIHQTIDALMKVSTEVTVRKLNEGYHGFIFHCLQWAREWYENRFIIDNLTGFVE